MREKRHQMAGMNVQQQQPSHIKNLCATVPVRTLIDLRTGSINGTTSTGTK